MKLPKFTAESSLGKPTKIYRGTYSYDAFSLGYDSLPTTILPSQLDLEGMEDLEDLGDMEDLEEAALMEEMEEMEGGYEKGEADIEEIESEVMGSGLHS